MQANVDPFHPLLRLMDRYRQDVHHLRPPATDAALQEAEQHLKLALPPSLAAFMKRWNGALLFRGVLRLRSSAELAPAHRDHSNVVLFADGPTEDESWAYVATDAGHVFGRWKGSEEAGFALQPMYHSYHRWLMGMLHLLEQSPKTPELRDELRLHCDPSNAFLLLRLAERHIAAGAPDLAEPLLRQATTSDPDLLPAWQRLGDVLVHSDTGQARWAYLKALRAVRLPLPYPGAKSADPDLLSSLDRLFEPQDAAWERELRDLLNQRVRDAHTPPELDLISAAAQAYARIYLDRGDRSEARQLLEELLYRSASFAQQGLLAELRLLLARLDTELGLHDEAEACLRPLDHSPDPQLRAQALLTLGSIVVARQEPWAEEILQEALHDLTDPVQRAEAWALLAERHMLLDRPRKATTCLEKARQQAQPTGDLGIRCRLAMLEGDQQRDTGRYEEARAAYAEAEQLTLRTDDREARLRLGIRAGDLAMAMGDERTARAAWSSAQDGFEKLSLPLRLAWVLLRLGRLGDRELLLRARRLFKAADLAAGVAATDAALQEPAESLQWHLERASEHARLRAEAQKPRPPLERADADRPERRLGAHQIAIAACEKDVVKALGAEVSQAARGLEGATIRPGDPRLAHYVAAVDLLAHHRSYEAARVLLDHLDSDYIAGLPGRALKSALARSPNAALAAGLLESLEAKDDPVALARAAEILGWRRERAAAEQLRKMVSADIPHSARQAAIMALGRVGSHEAIDDILPTLDRTELAEAASIALLLLGDRRAISYHAELLGERDTSLGTLPAEIVGRYGGPSFLLLLKGSVALDEELARGALMGLAYMGDPRGFDQLLASTSRPEIRVAAVASSALEIITGHHEPAEAPDLKLRWTDWLARNERAFIQGRRYRAGELLDPGTLIARLADDDMRVRRSAYDELVIATGAALPFDADGAWRLQVSHRLAWRQWWQQNRQRFPPGRWTFHGEPAD